MEILRSCWLALVIAALFMMPVVSSYWYSKSISPSPTPGSDGCSSYSYLKEYDRHFLNRYGHNNHCDYHLSGWYRFAARAGNFLLDSCPNYYVGYSSNYCGATYGGWMSGHLPSSYEGAVRRVVYFAYYHNCYHAQVDILVQNCGYFYIYYFQNNAISCNYRFCGKDYSHSAVLSSASASLEPTFSSTVFPVSSAVAVRATPSADPCYTYSYLSERNRNMHYKQYYQSFCDSGLRGWYRFRGAAGFKMLNQCPVYVVDYPSYMEGYCGARFQGWIEGSEPNWYEGTVRRTVKFAYKGDCSYASTVIFVRNCGGFLVYYFDAWNYMQCNYRFCGMTEYGSSMIQTLDVSTVVASASESIDFQFQTTEIAQQNTATPSLDGCKYYQVLSEANRAVSYKNWHNAYCDNRLNGWYRFMGEAGNRMLSGCPSTGSNSHYFCGAYWQGWLAGHHPSKYEGEVHRTVCFSRYYSCSCEYQRVVRVKSCGTYYVYRLDGVPACNQRYCGAKDRSAFVHCSSNYMTIELDRLYYNTSKFSSITLRDPSCSANVYYRQIILGSVLGACGATRQETPKHVIYTNEVVMVAKQTDDTVTRDHDRVLDFSCTFDRDGYVSGVSYEPMSKVRGNESGIGSFTFNFEMFKSNLYRYPYHSYPAKVKLRDYLYFQARSSVQDKGLVLLVDQCYSTPNMDRNHYKKYMFISNGCPVDKTVRFHGTGIGRQQFSMQAFRYLRNDSKVYIHCIVLLCQKGSKDFRCRSGCAGNNVNRVRRDLDASAYGSDEGTFSKYYLLEAGPVVLGDEKSSAKKQGGETSNQPLQTTVIALVVGVAALAIIVVVLLVKMRRRRQEAHNAKDEIGIDHAQNGGKFVVDEGEDEEKEDSAL